MPTSATRFSGSFQDSQGNEREIPPPQALRQRGPVLTATLTLSDRQQQAEAVSGDGSRSVSGSALIDTGASRTCLDEQVANDLGLTVFGIGRMTSASHSDVEVPLFVGKIVLPNITINVDQPLCPDADDGLGGARHHIPARGGLTGDAISEDRT